MIERDIIQQKTKEYYIKKQVESTLKGAGISQVRLKKIPLGEKIIIHASRPSLIVGSKGANIKELTRKLKKEFNLENPQVEIIEVEDVFLDARIVAERIANSLEKFGSARFKSIGHKIMENVLNSGALGIELIISGKIPGARAKSWRFYQGYLKKCGDVAIYGLKTAQKSALLKSGVIGIKVAIMPPDLLLPDTIEILDQPVILLEEITKTEAEKSLSADETRPKKRSPRKKVAKKEAVKKEKKPVESAMPVADRPVLETEAKEMAKEIVTDAAAVEEPIADQKNTAINTIKDSKGNASAAGIATKGALSADSVTATAISGDIAENKDENRN